MSLQVGFLQAIVVGTQLACSLCVLAADSPKPTDSMRKTVLPFLAQHCTRCHGDKRSESDLRLDLLTPDRAVDSDRQRWLTVLDQLSLGTMPPEGEPRPAETDRQQVIEAIRQILEIQPGTPEISELPGFGNYVDHRLLFTEPAVRKAASPARLWRISPFIFRSEANRVSGRPLLVVKKNQGGEGLHPAFPFAAPEHSFRDLSLPHRFEEATTELLVDMAWLVAGYQIDARRPAPALHQVMQTSTATAPYEQAIRYQFGLVLQRDPEAAELRELVSLAERTEQSAGRREALQTVLTAVLVMPEAVFRIEAGAGPPDEHGRVLLSPRELAFSISYALTDEPPDETLRAAVKGSRLNSRDDARREIVRLLNDDAIPKPRLVRFFREYFEYARVTEVFKDGRVRKHYMPEQLVEDADAVVQAALDDDQQVLRRLLTTNEFFINYAANGRMAVNRPDKRQERYYELFNLPRKWDWQAKQPILLPASQRAGLLTHPAWLLSFSDNEKNQAIQRGRWIRTKLLGGTVPDVPIGVDAQLPTDPHLTLREKMQVTRQDYCWRCHERMDPLGLPFEQFDDFGIFRLEELDRPVDTTGDLRCGIEELDGEIENPFEYVARLGQSRHVTQVFVRHAFRYWMGRNETLDDAPTLIDAEKAYSDNGGSMKALLTSLLTSDSFLYRRTPPADNSKP